MGVPLGPSTPDRSYRALLRAPHLARVLVSMQLGRIGEAMLPVILVLFCLTVFDSPPLAGLLTFLTVFPGLVAAPVIGALIDRFGRTRVIHLDFVTGAAMTAVLAIVTFGATPPAALLIVVTLVLGVTRMFSDAGQRSLFAGLVPSHLWERVNAVDSSGYQVAWIVGPPMAATLFVLGGPWLAFLTVAAAYAAASVVMIGAREPARAPTGSTNLARSTLEGIRYVWHNRTLRGLAISVSIANVGFGIVTILVPVLIVEVLGATEILVGLAFAVSGLLGVGAAVAVGRMDTLGREKSLIVLAVLGIAAAALLLLPAASAGVAIGTAWILGSMALFGLSGGILDIGIFTVRQRRTEPRMMGRAFATSMALNQSGFPIGAALGGVIALVSIEVGIGLAVGLSALGALLALILIPRTDESVGVPA